MDYADFEELPPLSASARLDLEKRIGDRREHYTDDEEDQPLDPPQFDQPPTVVSRDEWGAVPPFSTTPLKLPVKYIRFTYTGTSQCRLREDCDALVRKLQLDAIQSRKIPDIDYNFLVGGDDAFIYEGRGWFVDATRPKKVQYLRGNCIDIAFIGDFKQRDPHPVLRVHAENVVLLGQYYGYVVKGGLIDREPVVVPFRDCVNMRRWSQPTLDHLDPTY